MNSVFPSQDHYPRPAQNRYHGWVGIEYEGSKPFEADGIRATKRLLETIAHELRG